MGSSVVSLISLVVALIAVAVAIWQTRVSAIRAERTISLPVLTEIAHEVRSSEFHDCTISILTKAPPAVPDQGGFLALPDEFRKNAYRLIYFFDYLGLLTKNKVIPEDMAIDWVGTRLIQVWVIMEPFIRAEREHRISSFPPEAPKGFMVHYQHLVEAIREKQLTQIMKLEIQQVAS